MVYAYVMASHQATLDSLDHLKCMTASFLDFADWIGRPLLPSERRAFRFILIGWEAPAIRASLAAMPKGKLGFYSSLIIQLRELIVPDPVKQRRLKRQKPETVSEMNAGNFSVKAPVYTGVSVRRLNANEATERVQLMTKLADGIATLVRELSLVRNRDRPEAARIVKLGKLIAKLARAFAKRPNTIPTEKSMEELNEEMRLMGELLGRDASPLRIAEEPIE